MKYKIADSTLRWNEMIITQYSYDIRGSLAPYTQLSIIVNAEFRMWLFFEVS